MAKNRTMAEKHAKAKKEAGKAVAENNTAFMASGVGMAESAKRMIGYKPTCYLTPRGNARLRAEIVEKYRELDAQILECVKRGERISRELRREYQAIMTRVNMYGLQEEIRATA